MAIFTVFGNPVAHSLSPQIHQAFAQQIGVELNYTRSLTSASGFSRAVAKFFRSGGAGANVTVPFKQQAFELVTYVTTRAQLAGAVNTLVPLGYGQLLGDNTDGIGLVRDLQKNLQQTLANRDVVVLGAGGAARGVIAPLIEHGVASLTIANRSRERAANLVEQMADLKLRACTFKQLTIPSGAIVINATSASLTGHEIPIENNELANAGCVYDMVYGAQPTAFMQQAQQAGVATVYDGLGMLVEQAGAAFQMWHEGAKLDTQKVIQKLRETISG
ncbi:shikimate dehydrogenase [Pseudidiomarina marina]|uniref:shikimate dehydrogenase n=1 Tax=Pseudidiomarina marina TaxID=502366 RepID=UPI000C0D7298|nr:MAG: shikimate dehydrogenase [Idiomarina sp.]